MLARTLALCTLAACAAEAEAPTRGQFDLIVDADGAPAPVRPAAPDDGDVHAASYGATITDSVLFVRDLTEDRELPLERASAGVPHVLGLRAPAGHEVGVLVRTPPNAIAERIVHMPIGEGSGPLDVTLQLPGVRATGRLRFVVAGEPVDEWRPYDSRWLAGPETGIRFTVARGFDFEVVQRSLELPAGRYLVEMDGAHYVGCGVGSPSVTPYVAERMEVEVVAGASAIARPSLESGPHLNALIDVAGRVVAADAARETSRHAADGMWIRGEPTASEGAWLARVTIHRPDRPTRRELVEWGWRGKPTIDAAEYAPCAEEIYSVQRFAPGDYVLTVSGPRVVTKEFPVTITDGESVGVTLTVEPK
ncbi:MAG: hypothetical protein AAGI22_24135 [Planctomycetota bacterium]